MGYSYDSHNRLVCDACGDSGRVRKRHCPHLVTYRGSNPIPYCYAPAVCPPCWKARGGNAVVHGERCREGAARAQAQDDALMASLRAGGYELRTGWGAGPVIGRPELPAVPPNMVGARFIALDGREEFRLVPRESYQERQRGLAMLADFNDAQPWEAHP